MPFKPGQSGNPKGRRPVAEAPNIRRKMLADIKALAKEASEEAVKTLVEIMKDKAAPPAARASAANSILDRGWGKPQQTIEATVNTFERMTDAELIAFIASGADTDSSSESYTEH